MDNNTLLIEVDELDNKKGYVEKIKAHKLGILHRAFSIFLFNNKKEVLLQCRSSKKYHSPLLWANSCCSHHKPNVDIYHTMQKRLQYELGIENKIILKKFGSYLYRVNLNNDMIEHEFVHLFSGFLSEDILIKPNKQEVSQIKWKKLSQLPQVIDSSCSLWLKLYIQNKFDDIGKEANYYSLC